MENYIPGNKNRMSFKIKKLIAYNIEGITNKNRLSSSKGEFGFMWIGIGSKTKTPKRFKI